MALVSLDEFSILNNLPSEQNINLLNEEYSYTNKKSKRMFFDGRKIGDNKIGGKRGENFGSFDNCLRNCGDTDFSTKNYACGDRTIVNMTNNYNCNILKGENDIRTLHTINYYGNNNSNNYNNNNNNNINNNNNNNNNSKSNNVINNNDSIKNNDNNNNNNNNNSNNNESNHYQENIQYKQNEFDSYRMKFAACDRHLFTCDSALKRLEVMAGKQTANMGLVVHEPEILQK